MEQELQALQQELHLSKGRLQEQDATIQNMRNEEHVCLLVYYMHAFLLSEASTPLVKSLHLQCSERIWCCRLASLCRGMPCAIPCLSCQEQQHPAPQQRPDSHLVSDKQISCVPCVDTTEASHSSTCLLIRSLAHSLARSLTHSLASNASAGQLGTNDWTTGRVVASGGNIEGQPQESRCA